MERSEWSDDEPNPFRQPLPPDDRLWRHPSELHAGGPAPAPRGAPGPSRRRVALVVAAGTAGALLVGAAADMTLRPRSSQGDVAATTLLTSPATTVGRAPTTLAPPATAARPATTAPAVATTLLAVTTVPRRATTVAPTPTSVPLDEPPPPSTVAFTAVAGLLRLVTTTPVGTRAGAAVALDDTGTLVTSLAAVRDATALTVVLSDGQAAAAEVLGTDDGAGVAVLTVATATSRARLGRAAGLKAGSPVATPWPSSARGKIRELGMHASAVGGETMSHLLGVTMPSSSAVAEGEPLLDASGAVVALCTKDADGGLVAVPIELAHTAARSLRALGRIALPWLGISGMDGNEGPVIESVQADGPAAAAGVQAEDVVMTVDGARVATMANLVLGVRDHVAGEQVTLGVRRKGQPIELTVTLAEKPVTSP